MGGSWKAGAGVRVVGAASALVLAAGSATLLVAGPATAIEKMPQTITFTTATTAHVNDDRNLTATSDSGLPVSIEYDGSCTVSGSPGDYAVVFGTTGTCFLAATQSGNATYAAATPVTVTVTVSAPAQVDSITFDPEPATMGAVGDDQDLVATSASGAPVDFSVDAESSDVDVCDVDGNLVSYRAAGTCVIVAETAGSAEWTAAQTTRTIEISDAPTASPDSDHDGLTDVQEMELGTNPHKVDTDGDGLTDGNEVRGFKLGAMVYKGSGARAKGAPIGLVKTNPLKADTDGDGLSDDAEVNGSLVRQTVITSAPGKPVKSYFIGNRVTNPTVKDTDGDGLSDRQEVLGSSIKGKRVKSDPNRADTDMGGPNDGFEVGKGTNPAQAGR